MAATVSVKEVNGSNVATTVATAVYCTSDVHNPGTNFPLVRPESGNNWSYWKHHYLNADTAPSGTINNIKWFSDGSFSWTGVTMYVAVTATYTQATGTESTSGDEADGQSGRPNCKTNEATDYTAASPLSVAGSITANTGKISNYIVSQLKVGPTAVAGTLATETLTFRYDET